MRVTWGEPLAQKILSPGKPAMAAKLPRIYCHSSITEWPYFLGNIAVPQENLSHASYTSKWVKIQEPPKTVIRSYFKNTNAYTDCNTNPLVSCLGTCLSHHAVDRSQLFFWYWCSPKHSSTVFEENRSHFSRLSAICRQVGVCHITLVPARIHSHIPVNDKIYRKLSLEIWSLCCIGATVSQEISLWQQYFLTKELKRNPRPFPAPFFKVARYSLPDQRLLQHKLWLVQFRMVSENRTGML